MATTSEFKILHLSDAHIGNPKWSNDEQEVFKPLFKDIEQQAKTLGRPDLVVFSGDLVYGLENNLPSKLEEQFQKADAWLKSLAAALGMKPDELPLFLVPGNHDINRDAITAGDKLLTVGLGRTQVDDLLFKKDVTWQQLIKRLAEWKAFAIRATENANVSWNTDWLAPHKVVKLQDGKRIGISGLNTTWASFQSGERNKLWIGERQAQQAWNQLEGTDFRILVTHHPTSWLNELESAFLEQKFQVHFNLHMHGHEHTQWFPDSRGHLKIEAGACYAGSAKPASYSWISINCQQKRVRLHLRRWEPTGAGGWVAFHIPNKTDTNGFAETSLPFESTPTTPKEAKARKRGKSAPSQAPRSQLLPSVDALGLCQILRDDFDVRWEPPASTEESAVKLLYWPVKLRHPNVVHAAQAFIAAGLQQKGAEIYLWLDDFDPGEQKAEAQFKLKVRSWIDRAGGTGETMQTQSMRKFLETDQGRRIWETLRKWFTDQQTHRLGDVLKVSKLLPSQAAPDSQATATLKRLLDLSPKRLLSPPIVWTCLVDTLQRKTGGVVTLGGIDEEPLWDAWRRCIGDGSRQAGHIYAASLLSGQSPFDMDDASAWAGLHSVEDALRADLTACGSEDQFLRDGGMAHWCFQYCVKLPAYLAKDSQTEDWQAMKSKGAQEIIRDIPRAMEKWIF